MIPIYCALPIGSYTIAYGSQVTVNKPESSTTNLAASVASVQPDGSLQWRPKGTSGPYELATPQGDVFLFEPIPGTVFRYRFYSEAKA